VVNLKMRPAHEDTARPASLFEEERKEATEMISEYKRLSGTSYMNSLDKS
jgi:hypothetical protein